MRVVKHCCFKEQKAVVIDFAIRGRPEDRDVCWWMTESGKASGTPASAEHRGCDLMIFSTAHATANSQHVRY
jgi:hypothetical protein